jgi:RNA polymerase sigma-70 factor (ECF subfamily)
MATEGEVLSRPFLGVVAAEPNWDSVYAEQLPRVYNFFRYRFGERADAEDLTSRTFEKAWRSRHRYRRDVAAFSTWLLSIARNVAIDHQRGLKTFVPLDDAVDVAATTTPEDQAAHRSDADRLAALMAELPDRERELLALKYGAAMTNMPATCEVTPRSHRYFNSTEPPTE